MSSDFLSDEMSGAKDAELNPDIFPRGKGNYSKRLKREEVSEFHVLLSTQLQDLLLSY